MAMDQTPREFTEEEALYYAAGSEAIRTGDVRGLAQLISEHPELLYVYAPRNLREIGGRPLFQHLANWPGRWPRRLESAALLDVAPSATSVEAKHCFGHELAALAGIERTH